MVIKTAKNPFFLWTVVQRRGIMGRAPLTWEADELRAGTRKVPGYAGHLTGVQYTIGRTYGNASAEALSDDTHTGCKTKHTSAVLGHRHDGYTTQGNTM